MAVTYENYISYILAFYRFSIYFPLFFLFFNINEEKQCFLYPPNYYKTKK